MALMAGCGGGDSSGAVPPPPESMSEADVIEAGHLTPHNGGLTYTHDPSGCELAVILIGEGTVDLYASAGDNVASNPDRSIGVKITVPSGSEEQRCHKALTEELADL